MTTRTVLVTGAGSGFGRGTAEELLRRGHRVIATTESEAQADALRSGGFGGTALKLDVTDPADVASAATLGVDVLVNNAGLGIMAPLATVPMERVRASFEVNVFGMVAMSQAVIPGMRERGWGRIINVSSVAGVFASAFGSPYCMTKHAVEAFTKSLRAELAPMGIDVTKVNPGPYGTGFNDRMVNGITDYFPPGDAAAAEIHSLMSAVVLQNQLDPTEVARAIADLTEAGSTPPELFLPEGIKALFDAMVAGS